LILSQIIQQAKNIMDQDLNTQSTLYKNSISKLILLKTHKEHSSNIQSLSPRMEAM